MSRKPASGKLAILRGQPVKAQEALQTLEREFNLPAQTIKRQHALGRVLIPIKRGEKEQVPGCDERLGMRLPAPLHRSLVCPPLALAGGICAFAQGDEADRHGPDIRTLIGHPIAVDDAALRQISNGREEVKALAAI